MVFGEKVKRKRKTARFSEDSKSSGKPSKEKINNWFEKSFGHKSRDDYYIQEWYNRFDTPRKVWSSSDYARRETLKETFPNKFKGLSKDANLNNKEYIGGKFDKW